MATTYKTLTSGDRVVTTTDLYTSVAVAQADFSASSAQFSTSSNQTHFVSLTGSDGNVLFDVTVGRSSTVTTGSTAVILAKEQAIYKQMAQTLLGYDSTGSVRKFELDIDTTEGNNILHNAYFLNISRLQMKDEIKKETFKLQISSSNGYNFYLVDKSGSAAVTASQGQTGEYALLYVSSTVATGLGTIGSTNRAQGVVFYQAGLAVISPYIFAQSSSATPPTTVNNTFLANSLGVLGSTASAISGTEDVGELFASSSNDLKNAAYGLYSQIKSIEFQSTTELNSTVYFCRAFNNEFNYSSNPTYLSGSQIYVKNGDPLAEPVSYITTVGLYDDQNQLLAVAKVSEPIKKTPSTEFIARVRLDY
jgi:hypothetical protein